MADSTYGAGPRRPRPTPPPPRTRPRAADDWKAEKYANAGAMAGGFLGAMGGSFVPPMNITVNNNKGGGGGGKSAPAGRTSHFILGEPEFNTADDVRNYCNGLRAIMLQAAIELAMAGKILEARLAQAQTLPGDNPIQSRVRARRVGSKLKKASDGATAAAKSAVAAYGAFTREYADLMRPRPQRHATTNPFQF
ncbi:plasmid transfer protein TraA [Streptomyces sp. NPDC058417]|uniref:plasmid transfer protein TraA n=1 Tax=unclassified Streptomyces TaxID=2593676 RepID=UPI00366190CE